MRRLLAHARLVMRPLLSDDWFLRALVAATALGLAVGLFVGLRFVLA